MTKVVGLVSIFVILSFVVCQSFQFSTKEENSEFDIETLSRIDEALDRVSPFDRVKRSPIPKRGGRRRNRLRNGGDSSSESSESSESNSMSEEEEATEEASSEEEEAPATEEATTDITIEVFTTPLPQRFQRKKRGFWSSEESSSEESSESAESGESSEEMETTTTLTVVESF